MPLNFFPLFVDVSARLHPPDANAWNSTSRFNGALFNDFAILNHWSTQIRDAYSQTSSEDDAPDFRQHHFGTPGKRISRQGHEKHRAARFGRSHTFGPDCFPVANIRLHLVRRRLFAGIFSRSYVAVDVGRL